MPNKNQFITKNSVAEEVKWYTEEISIVISNYRNFIKKSTTEYATFLLPYFKEALNDNNPEVRKLAVEGLKTAKEHLEMQ